MGLTDRLRTWLVPPIERGYDWPFMSFNGNVYPLGLQQTITGNREEPAPGYGGLVEWAYRSDPIVFACMNRRAQLFAEARFQWRQVRSGRPGDLFGTADLGILENPWPNGTTGDLLAHMIQDVDLCGNAYITRQGNTLTRLRPDWVTIIVGSPAGKPELDAWDIGAQVVGYAYSPGGYGYAQDTVVIDASLVAHFAPIPDPLASFRGMSWLTPVLREIGADKAATEHKARYFENGATPNMVVTLDPAISKAAFDEIANKISTRHEGVANAYRTLVLTGGAKVEVVGSDLQQIDFKVTQGAGETRIAAAAGVPPAVAGFSEGLSGSSLNAGNFTAAMRIFADLTIRPLWRNACGSLETIVSVPGGAELWYDDRNIPALKEDVLNAAEVQSKQSSAIRQLLDAGFLPDSVVDAIVSGDLKRLEHSGLYSVQLQPPMPEGPPEPPEPEPPEVDADEAAEETPVEQAGRVLAEGFGIIRAYAEREQPAPIINVSSPDVNVTIEAGAVSAPEVTFAEGALRVDVAASDVTVEAPQVHVGRDAIRLTEYVPTRTVIDRDPETGAVTGSHEEVVADEPPEPAGDVEAESVEELTE